MNAEDWAEAMPCPVCGSTSYESVFQSQDGEYVGCDVCLKAINWEDYAAERAEEIEDGRADYEYESAKERRYEYYL